MSDIVLKIGNSPISMSYVGMENGQYLYKRSDTICKTTGEIYVQTKNHKIFEEFGLTVTRIDENDCYVTTTLKDPSSVAFKLQQNKDVTIAEPDMILNKWS